MLFFCALLRERYTDVIMSHSSHSDSNDDVDNVCPICLETMQDARGRSTHVSLDCGHKFHCMCILIHFRRGDNRCPCCRNTGRAQDNDVGDVRSETTESLSEVDLMSRRREYRQRRQHLWRTNLHFKKLRDRIVKSRENFKTRNSTRLKIRQEIRRVTPHLHKLLNKVTRQMYYHHRQLMRRRYELINEANTHLHVADYGWFML